MAWRRRLRAGLFWAIAGSVIALAVLVGLIQLALPWWASDADRVARLLSSRLGSPVHVEATRPAWSPRGPVIHLQGVRIGSADDRHAARIERAAWAIDFSGLVRPGRVFSEFRVHGLELSLERMGDGRWQVHGLPELIRGPARPLASVLRALPAFALHDSRLRIRHDNDQAPVQLALPELRRLAGASPVDRWRGRLLPATGHAGRPLLLALDIGTGGGRLHVAGEHLDLAAWLGPVAPLGLRPQAGELDIEAWIDLDDRGVHDVQFAFRQSESQWHPPPTGMAVDGPAPTGDTAAVAAGTDRGRLPALSFAGRWQRDRPGAGSHLHVDQLRFGELDGGRLTGVGHEGRMRLRAQDVPLEAAATVAALVPATPPRVRHWLRASRPRGQLRVLELDLVDGSLRQVALALEQLSMDPVPGPPDDPRQAGTPGLSGLALHVRGDRAGLVAWPMDAAVRVDYPGVLAEPVSVRPSAGTVAAWPGDEGWKIVADQLQLEGPGYQVRLAGGVTLASGQPAQLDLGAALVDSDPEAAKAFWPLHRIPNTARWLNRALSGGRIDLARAWIRGPANAFPFKDGSGRLDAQLQVSGVAVDYHEDWPALAAVDGELLFENASLAASSSRLRIGAVTVTGATIQVADLQNAIVQVSARARAPGPNLRALLARTPIERRFESQLAGMAIEGTPLVELALRLPLKAELGQSSIDGRLRFAGERFTDSQWNLDFDDLQGELSFSRDSLRSEQLRVRLAGEPAMLDLRMGAATREPGIAVEGELRGRLSAAALFGRLPALAPMLERIAGQADWRVRLQVPDGDEADAAGSDEDAVPGPAQGWLRVESDLRGIALALPAPLAKDAEVALPLRVQTGLRSEGRMIDLRLGQLLRLRARLPTPAQGFAGSIALGGAGPEALPERGLIVSGQVPALDLSGWLAMAASGDPADSGRVGGETTPWPRVILRAGELGVFGRAFREVDLQMRPGPETIQVRLLGPDIEGSLDWPTASAGRIVRGRFSRLHVPAGAGSTAMTVLRPGAMPDLDIEVDDARIGDTVFGRTRLLAQVRDQAYAIERFESRNPAFDLDASGRWHREQEQDRTDMAIRLRADDLGRMLESFGFAALVEGGATRVAIDGRWAGSPAAFALERIDGTLGVAVGPGRIVDVDPGVGRLFGLLNLREIPRRLMLDFRDFFSQGMRFNSIEGSFALNVGDAYTDNVVLQSPSADILVTGRTGLIMRDYDQTLEVSPRLGGTLPVVGALAAGPAGAAAGLVMQGLLRIDRATRIVYRVSGTWDDPEIVKQEPVAPSERRERGRGGPSAPAQP